MTKYEGYTDIKTVDDPSTWPEHVILEVRDMIQGDTGGYVHTSPVFIIGRRISDTLQRATEDLATMRKECNDLRNKLRSKTAEYDNIMRELKNASPTIKDLQDVRTELQQKVRSLENQVDDAKRHFGKKAWDEAQGG